MFAIKWEALGCYLDEDGMWQGWQNRAAVFATRRQANKVKKRFGKSQAVVVPLELDVQHMSRVMLDLPEPLIQQTPGLNNAVAVANCNIASYLERRARYDKAFDNTITYIEVKPCHRRD